VTVESTNPSAPILIVDDDAATRELVATYLRREGFETREASGGEAALQLIADEAISLVILDMRMPGMSGTDVVRALREHPTTSALPVMVLTGKVVEYPLAASLGVGADDYLTKPIPLDELVARVRAHLRGVRVAAEQGKLESEELYRALVEHSADGILVSDQTGRYVEANPAICRMLGYARDELLLMFPPSLSADDDPLSPEDMDERLAEARAGTALMVERRYRRRDGTSLPAEVGFSQLPDGRLQREIRDITERKRLEAERSLLAAAVEQAADFVIVVGWEGIIQAANPAFERLTGHPAGEAIGRSVASVLRSGVDPPEVYAALDKALRRGEAWSGQLVERRADGSLLEVDLSVSPIRDAAGDLIGSVEIGRDRTHEREMEAEREREAQIRVALAESLAHVPPGATLEQAAQAICDALVTLPFVDVATIQIFLGGDDVQILAQSAPPGYPAMAGTHLPPARAAIVRERSAGGPWARYAESDPADGGLRAAAVRSGLKALAYGPIGRGDHVVGALVLGTFDERFAHTLVEQMPGLVSFGTTSSALLGERMHARHVERNLRHGLEGVLTTRAFHPVFQPIVDLQTRETMGFEALTRFDSGQRPDLCFADAWSVGLGPDMELATLEAAVAAGRELPAGGWLDLNVSPRLLADPGRLREILWSADRALVLEVTEHELVGDYDALRAAVRELGHDIRLAVDDAGAGIANFGHIIDLRPDFVKLDISLVRRVNANLGRQAMVVGMRHFSRTAGCRLIAEGIETQEEAATLRALSVEFGQGYLYGHPGPAADWTAARAAAPEPSQLALPQGPDGAPKDGPS
jgi:PAS domain S-box-containing protein